MQGESSCHLKMCTTTDRILFTFCMMLVSLSFFSWVLSQSHIRTTRHTQGWRNNIIMCPFFPFLSSFDFTTSNFVLWQKSKSRGFTKIFATISFFLPKSVCLGLFLSIGRKILFFPPSLSAFFWSNLWQRNSFILSPIVDHTFECVFCSLFALFCA